MSIDRKPGNEDLRAKERNYRLKNLGRTRFESLLLWQELRSALPKSGSRCEILLVDDHVRLPGTLAVENPIDMGLQAGHRDGKRMPKDKESSWLPLPAKGRIIRCCACMSAGNDCDWNLECTAASGRAVSSSDESESRLATLCVRA
jgi:hypothetical protein